MHDLFLKASVPAKKKAVISAYNYLQMNATDDNFPPRGGCCHSPYDSPKSKDCPQRPFECLISTLLKVQFIRPFFLGVN